MNSNISTHNIIDEHTQFGHGMKTYFCNSPNYINVNHGSYGLTPRPVLNRQNEYIVEMEANCEKYFRVNALNYYDDTRKAIGELINAEYEDIALVENASTAVNSVLRSLPVIYQNREQECYFLYFNIAYGMVKQALYYLRDTNANVKLIEIVLDHESISSNDNIVRKVEEQLAIHQDKNIVMAVYDHITSVPAIVFPVKRLADLFKQRNILTLIDGAHAVGQVPIDIKELGVDYYLSNAHKWLFAPKSSAFLYIRRDLKSETRPTVVSFGYENRDFKFEYYWCGTRDLSSLLAAQRAIEWRREIGGETAIQQYCNTLASQAGELLAKLWGTSILISDPKERSVLNAAMVNVQIPSQDQTKIDYMSKELLNNHNSFLQVFKFDGIFYTRISCQIYNELSDYETVGKIVLQLLTTEFQS